MGSQVNSGRIAKNTLALYFRMIVIMAINFYTTRVVLSSLGVENYGIYNLVGTLVVVFSFLKSSLSEATQRFLNYSMGKNDESELSKVFSTCLNCYVIFLFIVVFSGELFWFLGGETLNIPEERSEAASFAFQMSLFSLVVSILQVPYNACIIAFEKMSFFAGISIVEALLKLLLTFLVSYLSFDKLKLYSILMLSNAFIIFVFYYLFCRRNFSICKYVKVWNKQLFAKILSFTGWNMLGSLSGVLSESGVGLVFNSFCGVVLNAAIGLSNQINNTLSGFISGYMTAFKPQIVKSYAAGQLEDFKLLLCRSSKTSFFLFFIISMPIIYNMDFLLHLWLVQVPDYSVIFSRIILIASLIDATSGVFYTSIGATGNIKYYQISISFVFFLHFVVTIILLWLGVEYYWVFLSRLFTRGLINFSLGLYFLKRNADISSMEYFNTALRPIVLVSILPLSFYLFLYFFSFQETILSCIFNTIFFEFLSFFSIYFLGFSKEERCAISIFIKKNKKI